MYLPKTSNKIMYTYSSNVININLTLTQEKLQKDYCMFILEGPFIGKYHAIISEDENELKLFSFGKGLFYGRIDGNTNLKPIFIVDKKLILSNDLKIPNGYIISCYEKSTSIRINSTTYEDCILFKLTYENGNYTIYIKENLGILLIRNTKNNKIIEEIVIKDI